MSVSSYSQVQDTTHTAKAPSPPAGHRGITFAGETFTVPETHDMVQALFDPTLRKSNFEYVVLALLASNLLVFQLVPASLNYLRIDIFIGLYVFWRLCYNFGIGYLLHHQSNHNKLVAWATRSRAFDPASSSLVSRVLRAEIRSQRGPDYDIAAYPIEFNTWLIFRKFVDLILMLDFVAFICLVVACSINDGYQFISNQASWLVYTRLVLGAGLIVFNLWVKVNAHNTIKDYAWYWGDFFFRQINNEELIFDGVFEMVPHPMYSVGYIGYYGFAIIAKSYTVLVVAIFGHFLQMIFLHYIENPHIDKIYGPSKNEINWAKLLKLKDLKTFDNVKPLVGLYNFNFLRSSDMINLILVGTYGLVIPVLAAQSTPLGNFTLSASSGGLKWNYMFLLTVAIKLLESFSINIMLVLQSHSKVFTKWYLSMDIPVEKSLNNWSVFYNTLINLTYSSLFGLNLYKYLIDDNATLFNDWFYLRIFIGLTAITTQVWINSSIIDLIGYFGWFYGDFFIPKSQRAMTHLTKAGVYRYLNNPEQIFGVCGVMGLFIMNSTYENLVLGLIWMVNNFIRINFIEKLHMINIYGEEVYEDSGVTKTFKKHLIPNIIQRRLTNDGPAPTGELRKRSKSSSITDSLDTFIKDLKNSTTKLSRQNMIELSQNLTFENSDYSLQINGLESSSSYCGSIKTKFINVGTPIDVAWKTPKETHNSTDWIGLYKVIQTHYSRTKTILSSSGRWVNCEDSEGSATFEGDKLFWEEGIYEFRYHLNGKHDVAYISEPFEIKISKVQVPTDKSELHSFATKIKSTIFDKLIQVKDVNDLISSSLKDHDNILETYELLSSLISKSTDIKISVKLFLNDDDNELTIEKLCTKLIHYKNVLEEL
ncbi:phosphatidyl ethanolamine N-methyltransferase [Suhomyces tanzawaensis NRRL Y-17324]|uniref:Phosphatidylethanolamine N-methyltransferase n=1 Tax=Suhomyces tanzawaensis NRRL Y-17324 TaxID=984487 RepID=A0A1E4SIT3_9ASCO|nr:phosphatidyl ethanolamine N-methyltransferase [Suhomyces tanzawaensis NRRL Y-17324]ODV79411.1 phosphatidyl ethanolamine N-methyltransferase [Suhomyces tanzawaensis NRRL Y-17324]